MKQDIIHRSSHNPILTSNDISYPGIRVYNSGIVKHKGKYLMLMRVDRALDEFDKCCFGLALSGDGVHFEVQSEQVMVPSEFENGPIYDPRITQIEDTFYICYAVSTPEGVRLGIAATKDFKEFQRISLSEPDNRNGTLFPKKINGLYARLDRPFPLYNKYPYSPMNIWLSFSPDLIHWGQSQVLLKARDIPWAQHKLGPGAPPILTDVGWLEIFHGVELTSDNRKIYRLGCMLLDKEKPWKIKGIAPNHILEPEEPYEKFGYVPDVVFTCGTVLETNGELKIYYGGADQCMALATADISDLVQLCERPAIESQG